MDDRRFDRAAAAVAECVRDGESLERNDLQVLDHGLRRMIGSHFNRLEAWEVVEVASDSISRYWDAAERGLVDLDANPAAYLSTIARNAALDLLAGSPRADDEPLDDEGAEDIDLERILNREQALSRLTVFGEWRSPTAITSPCR